MPAVPSQPRPRPTYYRRWSPATLKVAAKSDQYSALPLHPHPALQAAVACLADALASARAADVQAVSQRIADGVCIGLGVSKLRVIVQERRPHDSRSELHGLYVPGNRGGLDQITLWMLTAKKGQVVAYRTFLRTLLHELCHHLDYTYLRLRDSPHTQGFYQRESSLFAALGAAQVATERR
ncbi:MAG TPA: hypothetical protein VGR62_10070 [Candidatus Binatia bacterium]|jgi:hypothetical protein|nr:hypothetical protein [Candidatus Binatia bacterium]